MNRFILHWLFIAFLFYTGSAFSQNRFELEETSIKNDSLQNAIVAMGDGGFATKSISYNPTTGGYSIIVTKFNGCTALQWSRKIIAKSGPSFLDFPGSGQPEFISPYYTSITKTENDGLLVAYTHSDMDASGNLYQNIIATKMDSSGKLLWSKKIHSAPVYQPLIEGLSSAYIPNDGYVIFAKSDSLSRTSNGIVLKNTGGPFCLLRLRQDGKILWSKNYKNGSVSHYDAASIIKVIPMSDRGFILDFYGNIGRTDSSGKLLWMKGFAIDYVYNGAFMDFGNVSDLTVDSKDGIYIYNSFSVDSGFLVLFKLNPLGDVLWGNLYKDSFKRYLGLLLPSSVLVLKNKHIILSNRDNFYKPEGRAVLIEADSIGQLLNSRVLSDINIGYENNPIYSRSVPYYPCNISCATSDTGYMIMGFSPSLHTAIICKTSSNVTQSCNSSDRALYSIPIKLQTTDGGMVSLPGYAVTDTIISLSPFASKIFPVCSSGFMNNANLGSDTFLCSGQSYTLYKGTQNSGSKTYWSTRDTTDSIVVTKSGRYWLQLSHGYCTSSDTVNIIFKSLIKTGLPKTQSICPYDSVQLVVKDTIASYYWVTPKKKTIQGRSIMARDSGYYYLMLNGTSNCALLDTVHVMYYPLPQGTAGPDTILCRNETYTMRGAGGITYLWTPATYLSSATDPKAQAILPNTEQYTLVVSNAQGCHDTTQVLLTVRPLLAVKAIINNATVCYGHPIVLSAKASGGDSLHYQFNWTTDNLSGDSISEKLYQSGWHKVVLNDNCTPASAMDSVYVTVIPPVKAAFIYSPAAKVETHHNVSFINQSANASSYLWTFGTKDSSGRADSSKETSPAYIYTDSGDYKITLVAYGLNNCPNDTAYGFIKIISDEFTVYIPNAFSPNGDGINDFFDITGVGIKSYSYNIYNRWGECIYSSPLERSGEAGWDGTFKGAQMPEGVYIYMLDVVDTDGWHHYLNGNVTLMR